MKIIRKGIFETNSSSTHSLVMCKKEEYEAWKKGDVFYNICDQKFLTPEQADVEYRKMVIDDKTEYESRLYTYKGMSVGYDQRDMFYTEANLAEVTEKEIQAIKDDEEEVWDRTDMPLTFDEYETYLDEADFVEDEFYEELDGVVVFGYYGRDC